MNKHFFLSLIMWLAAPVCLFAQQAKISGHIVDEGSNALLPGVSVSVVGSNKTTTTDFEGDYTLQVDPGVYTLRFSYIGYTTKEITEVKVAADKATTVNVALASSSETLDEVVISVSARRNTEASLLGVRRNSAIVMDGLSSQAIVRSGASNIASAVRAIPGVSVQGGKYLYVRGLGDRYTKSILNGVDIPGLDPDKNTVQMDIFPTGVLENVVVMKSASAELPADFTGGVVDIVTKDIPAEKEIGLSLSLGYNPNMHFKDNFVTYQGSGTDFLGFDNGDRKLPLAKTYNIPRPTSSNNGTLEEVTRSFNPLMAAERKRNNLPDMNLGFNYNNQYNLWGNKLGLIGVLNYRRTTLFYEGFENGIYWRPNKSDQSSELREDRRNFGDLGETDVLLSGMLGLNYKTARSKYSLNLLHIQNGESSAALYNQTVRIANSDDRFKHTLGYSQRSISNLLISGKHSNQDADFITEWKVSPSLAKVGDKDIRTSTFLVNPDGTYTMNSGTGMPTRIWRDLEEFDVVNKLDFTKKLQLFNREASLKFGGLYSYKHRDYAINEYTLYGMNFDFSSLNGDPNRLLLPENIWTRETNTGVYMTGNYQPANVFEAAQHTRSLYVSGEFKPAEKIKAIIGLRGEQYVSYFTGEDIDGTDVYDNEKTIDKLDLFPSLNLVYNVVDNHNLRLSYSRTTARPSFKELSVIQIYDPLTDTRFLGNIDLKPTYINNIDLRYEIFGDQAEMVAVSGFYKKFTDPIELQAFSGSAPSQFTPRNVPSANVYGFEVEARKNFGFISEGLRNLSLNLNVSVVESEIEMTDNEYSQRLSFAREGQEISRKRELQGQSPYLVNAGLNYTNVDNGLEAGVFYNVQGKTLEIIGATSSPDVYAKPFNSLNFNFSKKIGRDFKAGTINFKVDNLLDAKRLSVYQEYLATDQIYSLRRPRRTFTVGYSYNF